MSFVDNLMSGSLNYEKDYKIDIVAKRSTLVPALLGVDNISEKITIKADNIGFENSFEFSDVIGIVPEEDIETSIVHNMKLSLKKKFNDNYFENMMFVFINYYPNVNYKSCNLAGAFCCKCTTNQRERRKMSIEILMSVNSFKDFKREFYQTNIFNELNPHVKKRILVFINPLSGKGQSRKIWEQVKGIFALANIETDVIETEYKNHAYDVVINMDKTEYNGIVACSGDGINHEIINGILNREDKDDFIKKIPIGSLPGGTSNALSETIISESNEKRSAEVSAFIIAKGCHKDMDLQEVELLSENKKLYSFLSLSWSIIADIDLESETIRCCGKLRKYFGTLYYLPQQNESKINLDDIPSLKEPLDEDIFTKVNEQFNLFLSGNIPCIGEDINCLPKSKINDGYIDMQFVKGSVSGRCSLFNYLVFHFETGDIFDAEGKVVDGLPIEYLKTKAFRLIPKQALNDSDEVAFDQHFNTFYSIDGENYPIGPIQMKTIPNAIKIFCLNH